MHRFLYLLISLAAVSCSTSSIGYFEVQPASPADTRVNEALYIDFGSNVKNRFAMTQGGINTLNVRQFRETFRYALGHTLGRQFKEVRMYTGVERGLVLRVREVRSQWLIGREKRVINQAFHDTMRVQDFACFLRYSSTLYYNNAQLSVIDGEIRQKPDYSKSWRIENLFEQTLKISCEDMARKISKEIGEKRPFLIAMNQ